MNALAFAVVFLIAAEPPRGALIPVGGGTIDAELRAAIIREAGGPKTRMLVAGQASSDPNAGKETAEIWRKAGVQNVQVLSLDDPAKAAADVKAAEFLWFGGGDQNRLAAALRKANLIELIRVRYRDGLVVGGTSAGAAVLSTTMITGEGEFNTLRRGAAKTAEGLGVWPEVIVDQHFIRRSRMNRLLSLVSASPNLVGVGIDEGTAVVLRGGRFRVEGVSSVVVFDGREAKPTEGTLPAVSPIATHVLRRGWSYDLASRKAIPPQ